MTGIVEIAAKIGLSALLAGAVGAEREWTGKWAGVRTHMLIAIGATLLSHVSHAGAPGGGASWDGGRIAAQIVSGVGFIGAGTILQSRGAVHGLTTAAGLWVAAAIGIAVGGGFYLEAAFTGAVLLVVLTLLPSLERRLLRGNHRTVTVRMDKDQKVAELTRLIEDEGLATDSVHISRRTEQPVVTILFRGSKAEGRSFVATANRAGFAAAEEDAAPEDEAQKPPF